MENYDHIIRDLLSRRSLTVRLASQILSMPPGSTRRVLDILTDNGHLRKIQRSDQCPTLVYCLPDMPVDEALAAVREDRQEQIVGLAKMPVTVRDVAEHLSIGKGHAWYRLEALVAAKVLRKFKVPGLRRKFLYYSTENTPR